MSQASKGLAPSSSMPNGDLGTALRGYAWDQLAEIDAHLRRHGRHLHRSVHEARKAIRRSRAVLALASAGLGSDVASIDRALQRLGRRLSQLRDAQVLVELVERRRSSRVSAETVPNELIVTLRARRDALADRTLAADPAFKQRRRQLARIQHTFAALNWPTMSGTHILEALQGSAQRMQRASVAAKSTPTLDLEHRWRRRARRLRMQLQALELMVESADAATQRKLRRLLGQAASALPTIAALAKLVDMLGARQDQALLQSVLSVAAKTSKSRLLSSMPSGVNEALTEKRVLVVHD